MDYQLKNKLESIKDISEDEDIISKILRIAKDGEILFIRLQFIDILGVPKNIVIPVSRLEESLEEGMPFDASSIAGYATIEESDKIAKPDPYSFTILPENIEKRKTAKINCDIYEPNGKRFNGDTKYILEKIVEKLEISLSEVKTLTGLLPICASCKKIRDDRGYWNQIESYIKERSDADFSHSICPECADKLYPEYDLSEKRFYRGWFEVTANLHWTQLRDFWEQGIFFYG